MLPELVSSSATDPDGCIINGFTLVVFARNITSIIDINHIIIIVTPSPFPLLSSPSTVKVICAH